MLNEDLTKPEIENWLRETDAERLATLWEAADRARLLNVGKAVHLRGLLEISNYCVRSCTYCGINRECPKILRYRLSEAEIMASVNTIAQLGYGTVVMQAGEDYGLTTEFIVRIIRKIKATTPLAVTLSWLRYGRQKANTLMAQILRLLVPR